MEEQDDVEIREVVTQVFKNWSSRNPDSNDSCFLANDQTVLFDVAPMKDLGWDSQKNRLRDVFKDFEQFSMEPMDDLKSYHIGELGWATTTWKAKILLKNNETIHHEGRGTFVLKKQGERWFVVHDHISLPLKVD